MGLFQTLLQFLFIGFLAFTSCDYTLSKFFKNSIAVVVSAGVFAVLCALFLTAFVKL